MRDDDLTGRAADLAERILEEVSIADRDWRRIAAWARELARLAEAASASGER